MQGALVKFLVSTANGHADGFTAVGGSSEKWYFPEAEWTVRASCGGSEHLC